MTKQRINRVKKSLEHKKAFIYVERELTGKNTILGYLHDCDKILAWLFLPLPISTISKIHKKLSIHHICSIWPDRLIKVEQAVIDWECSRLTKLDKPETAREFYERVYKHKHKLIEPVLQKFKL